MLAIKEALFSKVTAALAVAFWPSQLLTWTLTFTVMLALSPSTVARISCKSVGERVRLEAESSVAESSKFCKEPGRSVIHLMSSALPAAPDVCNKSTTGTQAWVTDGVADKIPTTDGASDEVVTTAEPPALFMRTVSPKRKDAPAPKVTRSCDPITLQAMPLPSALLVPPKASTQVVGSNCAVVTVPSNERSNTEKSSTNSAETRFSVPTKDHASLASDR
mmetsp:Transcript_63553/g.151916  ORF Transcript_63553/g.151916 Transcript_63553/m.151916 type:complete len:220 (-) Transcript_63553:526-1185(-)